MENQHRKITGYRDLSKTEINLMNKIKELGVLIESVILEVDNHLKTQSTFTSTEEEKQRIWDATPERFKALAETEFQTGLMYLTRAVAQPTSF